MKVSGDGEAIHAHQRDCAQPIVVTVPHVGGLPSADLDNPQNDEASDSRGGPQSAGAHHDTTPTISAEPLSCRCVASLCLVPYRAIAGM